MKILSVNTREQKRLNALLWLVGCGFFMQTLDATIVNTALPAMARTLGESPLHMQSVIVAYSLTMAMLIPASGWISDKFGTRLVYMSAIAFFVTGSLLCAVSHNLVQLVAARIVQGMGGAMLLPVGRLSILRSFPRNYFLPAMSFVAVPGLIGPLIGPTLGGWLVEVASWHWIFLINVPVGIIGGIAALLYMQDSPLGEVPRFDIAGYLLLAFGMVCVSLALDGLSNLGLHHAGVLVLMIFGLASLTTYWLHAARHKDPLFSPDLFSIPTLSIGLLGNLFSRLGSSCMPFLIPVMMQVSMGYTPFRAGMMMLPVAMVGIAVKQLTTPLITRAGYRNVLVANTILIGLVMATFALTSPDQPWWLHAAQLACFGAVNSLQFTAMNTLALKDLDPVHASGGNSLLSMVQMLAMGMGVASAGGVLAAYTDLFGTGSPAQTLDAFHATFATMGLITLTSAGIFWQLTPQENVVPAANPATLLNQH
jgi:EmrB/QacA subfamily drug resistance transporter